MTVYYGTKRIKATKMNRQDYNNYRQWVLPSDENGSDEGYLVEYLDGGSSNDSRHTGYISWSPKEVFDKSYQPYDQLSFGHAVQALKEGHKVARSGWNGNGIFISLQIPDENSKMTQPYLYIDTTGLLSDNPNAPRGVIPWLASQTDMLAEDWSIV